MLGNYPAVLCVYISLSCTALALQHYYTSRFHRLRSSFVPTALLESSAHNDVQHNDALSGTSSRQTRYSINTNDESDPVKSKVQRYSLGANKHAPVSTGNSTNFKSSSRDGHNNNNTTTTVNQQNSSSPNSRLRKAKFIQRRKMVIRDQDSQSLSKALWDVNHYENTNTQQQLQQQQQQSPNSFVDASDCPQSLYNPVRFSDIDLSVPESVFALDGSVDLVWDLLRYEAFQQALREPLLVSFLHSTILNHPTLESSLAFLLANRLQSPGMMISTQLQALILQALTCPTFRRYLRADMLAVRDRDPACQGLPDVFLYFKGFHALQSYRVSHCLWNNNKPQLARFLQSQVSQSFQIDIHPNSTLLSGIMLDHGTGIVIGETATVGHNCSILHQVTLGGSGKTGVVRHPQIGDGVLLGAGSTILGPITVGANSQVGAGTLVITDLPAHCVAVGVPARIIGSFVNVTEQPSIGMNQMVVDEANTLATFSDGI